VSPLCSYLDVSIHRIVSCARKSFSTNGFAGTTNRAIAQAAGVDAALVSYYFPDKAALLAAALEPPAWSS
jgi:AcrR family transcriptional regulator